MGDDPYADLALTTSARGVGLAVQAVPRSARTALDGVASGALRVRLAAPPVDGAANKALIAFLAEVLRVPKRDVSIASGEQGRRKVVRVQGLSPEEIRLRLTHHA